MRSAATVSDTSSTDQCWPSLIDRALHNAPNVRATSTNNPPVPAHTAHARSDHAGRRCVNGANNAVNRAVP
jgi:hypothetical protein